ncbi:ferredoxin--NADP reductase [Portibacter marinus]|uniref:ferredoxin--NADP reductase n=1 Tax=Portibacter marinus TaxID=2898660 RepID=UPI001F15EBC8|nr:FAD-binding oxidoreductase [Portibacter marinus]
MAWQWYDGTVVGIQDMTPNVKQFFIEVDGVDNFEFKAGQFVTLDLPIAEKRLKRWRSYSIANEPNGTNIFELCIVHLKGGLGSGYMFEEVTVGCKLRFKGPSGAFYLPKKLTHDLVMVCTGTGVAPFRSMIKDLVAKDIDLPQIHLIFGARYEQDILYREEFEALTSDFLALTYDVCLSRDEEWDGFQGYVHQVYMERNYSEGTKFYLCGWSQMIDEAVENLLVHKKVDKKNIIYELYG